MLRTGFLEIRLIHITLSLSAILFKSNILFFNYWRMESNFKQTAETKELVEYIELYTENIIFAVNLIIIRWLNQGPG